VDDDAVKALVAEKTQAFDEVLQRTEVLYPDAAACVERLARDFPLGIASGALRHEIEMILRRAGLHDHFHFIVAAGDTPRSKPWPDPYVRAAQLHGVPPSACVAIEDSRWGIESAKAAGLKCVGITTAYPASQLRGADHMIESLREFDPELIRTLGVTDSVRRNPL
jgi:beta-phosphoglucomutase